MTIQEELKPQVIDIIMNNPKYKKEILILMKSKDFGEAMFGDWIEDKVKELKNESN